MNREELISLLRRLFKAGLRRLPRKQRDATALLALSLTRLDPVGIYDEVEIDQHLSDWLARISVDGQSVDHVTWRRALVDFRFLRRATDGAIYRIRPEVIDETLSADARTVDPLDVLREVEQIRQQRQSQFGV
ncbi:MAG: DUF2087 domain-containing protein [Pseudomonadales bacterium]